MGWKRNKNARLSDVYHNVRIGDCSTTSSAQYHIPFGLDVGADYHLDLFSLEILHKYRNVVASKSNYEDGYTHYYFG